MPLAILGPATHVLAPSPQNVTMTHPVTTVPSVIVPPRRLQVTPGLTPDTGMDMASCSSFAVCGTDLGIPFKLPNGSIGYLFGDTFTVMGPFLNVPAGADHYRSQVMLRSNTTPVTGKSIIFDNAAGLSGTGEAPELLNHGHLLPNDGVGFPETGDIILSYQDVGDGMDHPIWSTSGAGLAISHDGGNHFELVGPTWPNNTSNTNPYQMWSMQRSGDFVYIITVRAGRQSGPMMLMRVPWDQMIQGSAYQYWNGVGWGAQSDAQPILQGTFGEPSLRLLPGSIWAMSYTDYSGVPKIVTSTAKRPQGPWSQPKVQLTWKQLPALYGGFIHPYSTPSNLILMVSAWETMPDGTKHGRLIEYDVSHLVGTL